MCRGKSQNSILDPLLFNIFIKDIIFIEKSGIYNFTDGSTIYVPEIKEDLICTMKNILKWFRLNS